MEHREAFSETPPAAPLAFLTSPLGIAVLVMVSTFGGSWVKDQLINERRDTTSVVRLDALDQRMRDQQAATAQMLADIRQDLRDIKLQIDDRSRALAGSTAPTLPLARR